MSRIAIFSKTSFCGVNSYATTSGVREIVILAKIYLHLWHQNVWKKKLAPIGAIPLKCNYPDWVFHRLQSKIDYHLSLQDHNMHTRTLMDKDRKINNPYIMVLYSKGLSKSFRNVCSKVGVQAHFKEGHHHKSFRVPKDKDNIISKSGLI